jgi:small conductance mechanosensitive channel
MEAEKLKERNQFMKTIKTLITACLVLVVAAGLYAEEASYVATTTANPKIAVGDLELLLRPLRRDELAVEAEAWLDLLQQKVQEISTADIKMKEKGREITEKKEDIKEQIQQIKEEDERKSDSPTAAAPNSADPPADLKAAEAVQQKIENIEQKTEEITEAAEEVTETIVADINAVDKKEVLASEKDLLKKAEDVEAAKEKLKEAAAEISQSDIKVEDKVKKIGAAEIDLHSKVKDQLLAGLNKLREEQAALIDRFQTVTAALEEKGGDIEEYTMYVTAISGLVVDIEDISAARAIILGWLKSPEGGIKWGKMILSFVLIIIVTKILSVVLGSITRKAITMNKQCSELLQDFFVNVVRKTVFVIGMVVALGMLGVNIGPMVAGIGAMGFIIGFALQGTLGNFAAGLMILMHRPYDVGDVVCTAGVTGIVQSMNLNTTTIKTFDNQVVVVPNGSIWGDNIINVTGSDTRRVDLVFGIGYSDDIAKAQGILEDIVTAHDLVLKDPAPNIKVHELADSSVNFICRPWVKTSDYWAVYWDITRSVKERFDADGVSIPFPQRDVHIIPESAEA